MALSGKLTPCLVGVLSLLAILSGCATSERSHVVESKPVSYYRKPVRPPPVRQHTTATARRERPRSGSPQTGLNARKRFTVPRDWLPAGRRISSRWRTIVLHHSGTKSGGARSFDKYHREKKGWDELGYHFVIGNGTSTADGMVEVGPRWRKQKHGAHCKTPNNYFNEHGIGICLVGDFTASRPTAKQMASLDNLLRFLCTKAEIPYSRVTSHGEVNRKTRCPGRHFPMARLRRALVFADTHGPPLDYLADSQPPASVAGSIAASITGAVASGAAAELAIAETIGSAKLQPILSRSVRN